MLMLTETMIKTILENPDILIAFSPEFGLY